MYYSEINKIIEAGLDRDKEKVSNYARLLARKLEEDGEIKSSKRVLEILKKKNYGSAVTDALVAPPVDQESRMNIIEIDYHPVANELVFSKPVQLKLKDFEDTVNNKSQMDELGLEFNLSLLLYGHPGCGKTSAARYIASQLKLPLVIARLDTLISSLLGNTAKNIHKIFEYAKKQPCVLFLDEFDAIAKARDDQHELGELKRVVNSLLQNMDEYCKDGILVAATNHHELLDKAIWRRFQTVIELPKPGIEEIQQLFNQLPKMIDYTLIKSKQWQKIENSLLGLSYSDIKSILQNMVKKVILNKQKQINFTEVLAEVYLFKNHGDFSMDEFVQYMINNGVSQKQAANYFQVSTRQIRNSLERMGSL
jgi:SpoVK/Ycf46/Vps4 family AAA+-type ATPase